METTFTETKIGRIPVEWEVTTIDGILANNKNAIVDGPFGSNMKISDYVDSGTPVLQGKNITGNKFVWSDIRYISCEKAQELARSKVVVGDILVVKIGSIGYSALIDTLHGFENAVIPANLLKISINQEVYSKSFLLQYLWDEKTVRRLQSSASQTAQPALSLKAVKRFQIVKPPLPEQRKIAEILSTIDETIETTDVIIQETQQLKKGLMQKLFTEGIGHTKFKETKIGRIPKKWELRPAEKVCIRVTDGTHDTPKPADEGYFLVTSKNLKNGNLTFEDCYRISEQDFHAVNRRSKVDQYDVIYGMIGTIGNPVMITQECVDFAIKNVGLFKTGGDKQLGAWLVHYLCSKKSLDFMERHKNGTSQNFIPLGLLREFPIPIPQDEEIKRINGTLSECDARAEKEQAFKAELEQLKKGLMQVLLTGQVRVKV